MENSDLVKNFVAGAIAGSLVAILFAPRSGKNTRTRVAKYFVEKNTPVPENEIQPQPIVYYPAPLQYENIDQYPLEEILEVDYSEPHFI